MDLIFSAIPIGLFASPPSSKEWLTSYTIVRVFQTRQPLGMTHGCTWCLHQFQATISIEEVAFSHGCKVKWQTDPLRLKTTAPTVKTTSPNTGRDLAGSVHSQTWSRKPEPNLNAEHLCRSSNATSGFCLCPESSFGKKRKNPKHRERKWLNTDF